MIPRWAPYDLVSFSVSMIAVMVFLSSERGGEWVRIHPYHWRSVASSQRERPGRRAEDSLERHPCRRRTFAEDLVERRPASSLPRDVEVDRCLVGALDERDHDAGRRHVGTAAANSLGDALGDDLASSGVIGSPDAVRNFSRTIAFSSDSQTPRIASTSSVRSPFQRAMVAKMPSSFSSAGTSRVRRRARQSLGDTASAIRSIDGLEQRRLRVEVVIERAPRRIELVEDVLDAHLLVALRLDETSGGVEERFAPYGVADRIECPGHGPSITDRLSV